MKPTALSRHLWVPNKSLLNTVCFTGVPICIILGADLKGDPVFTGLTVSLTASV